MKLIELIRQSEPPTNYYPKKGESNFLFADQARNITNAVIFLKRIQVLNAFMSAIESDVLTNCSVKEIQQFHDLKFIVSYLYTDIAKYKDRIALKKSDEQDYSMDWAANDFFNLRNSYKRLIEVCDNPGKDFNYSTK